MIESLCSLRVRLSISFFLQILFLIASKHTTACFPRTVIMQSVWYIVSPFLSQAENVTTSYCSLDNMLSRLYSSVTTSMCDLCESAQQITLLMWSKTREPFPSRAFPVFSKCVRSMTCLNLDFRRPTLASVLSILLD